MEVMAQPLSSFKVQTVFSSSSLTPIYPESPHKGLITLTLSRHHSGTKIAEEETGSIPHSSAAATGIPQASMAWSEPQQSYSRGARLLEGKLRNRNTSSSTIWTSTQRPNQKVSNYSDDRWINPQKWEETSAKKEENTRNWNTSPPARDHNPSPAREKSWMKNECDEMTELDFRRGIMRNFCELKEHVFNQWKKLRTLKKDLRKW